MATDIVVPALGESVTEATIAKWLKQPGDKVAVDEPLLELETDKVSLEVYATKAGTLSEIRAKTGDTVEVGAVVGVIGDGAAATGAPSAPTAGPTPIVPKTPSGPAPQAAAPAPQAAAASPETVQPAPPTEAPPVTAQPDRLAPAVRKLVEENKLAPEQIPATGKTGRLTKTDVLGYLEREGRLAAPVQTPTPAGAPAPATAPVPAGAAPREERVRMTRLRKRIAERLKQAQNNAAMLTTFNEVDMTNLLAVRSHYKDAFEKKHGVKLGFMSFFVKAAIMALKEIPAVNGEIDGEEIVYKNHYDIGVAVGTEQGLVVPVVRDADKMSFAEIELKIADFGKRARDGKLALDELQGGTFTISNGGVYGSLMSTPILNPPQSGILGMHKTQDRPVAIAGKVEIRPMMYLALSYDHRIVDGREAVTFLVRLKDGIEDPQRMLLEI
ncbi:dihydrolipoyllysine-residue succinyltransferase component of 2-oxoglutarate dehydrogenase complex [Hypericibacter terrae]|uniref:Dihydrolipoyllysine-residue succinyltransferase component of 2-oxoglutarate dehydrogenase complex n=1 Tax=Hypericibacter terrae TaxID=2602015 RepID=A0A5J6MQ28_9PROT|nr:2-oxoglutarate dehydrogenase complex dihydrolipoyllysine-residue succinyltransferase [Hypericibacter terrae]QEX19554.1 dihydrolipoyllysine-residue succinyltransferase component of 2-oxoglutarate dehydrogenase complex [Hypericibacter terrae]